LERTSVLRSGGVRECRQLFPERVLKDLLSLILRSF